LGSGARSISDSRIGLATPGNGSNPEIRVADSNPNLASDSRTNLANPGSGPQLTTPGGQQLVVFLCPNGHKLNGPASLQGRPGKCPHCGARFIIPKLDEESDDDSEYVSSLSGNLSGQSSPADEDQIAAGSSVPVTAGGSGQLRFDFADLGEALDFVGASEAQQHPMGGIFVQLWQRRPPNTLVELYLKGGEILTPDWYAPRLSQNSYGLFGLHDTDGSYSLVAVNWDSVDRVALRGMSALPKGLFGQE
jgi:hypothetical protein